MLDFSLVLYFARLVDDATVSADRTLVVTLIEARYHDLAATSALVIPFSTGILSRIKSCGETLASR